tara:strand:+ start:1412 stop:1624 length:213 start_codon:yes stop_codon:yes gene_type:complete
MQILLQLLGGAGKVFGNAKWISSITMLITTWWVGHAVENYQESETGDSFFGLNITALVALLMLYSLITRK